MRRILASISLVLLSSTAFAQKAAPQYTSLWSLGDSLSDVGRTYDRTSYLSTVGSVIGGVFTGGGLSVDITQPKGPLYYKGHFSNGQVWVEYLSKLNNLPYNADRNLAWGGAVTGTPYSNALAAVVQHLEQQVGQFDDKITGIKRAWYDPRSNVPAEPASSYGNKPLITFWIGGNNFRQQIEDTNWYTFISNRTAYYSTLGTQKEILLKNIPDDLRTINATINNRKDIAQLGATYYVPTIADVSTTPKFIGLSDADRLPLSATIKDTNRELKARLYNLGDEFTQANAQTRLVVIDSAALLAEVQRNPTAFGFKNARDNCVDSETGKYTNGCSAANVGDYLFWDQFHPTTKAHEMIAQYAQTTDYLEYGAAVTLTQPYVANIEIRNRDFNGTIAGTGSMIKQGEKTLTLAGANSYKGGTRVDNGLVRVSSDRNLGDASGVLTLQGGGVSASQSFTMLREVRVNASVSYGEIGGTTFGGTFNVDPGAVLTLQGSALSGTGSIRKNGAGTLDIRTSVTSSRDLTQVDAGLLKINTTGEYRTKVLNIGAQGSVGGSGIIVGTVNNAGRLLPGNSIGTLTIQGDLIQQDSGSYQLEVDTNRTDNLIVTGTMTLDGDVSVVTDATDKLTNQTFTVARSTGTMVGQYDEVVDLSPFLSETLSYSANSVSVTFARNFAAPAVTANQRAVAAHLNASYQTGAQGDLDNVFYGLDTTGTNAVGAAALDQLSGQSIGNLLTADAVQRGQFTRALEDRISARRSGRGVGDLGANASMLSLGADSAGLGGALQDASAAVAQSGPGQKGVGDGAVSAWARVLGGPTSVGGAGAFDMTGVGVLLGVDKVLGNGLVGISLGYGNFDNNGDTGGDSSADSYQVSLYGSLQSGNWFLDGTLGYAYSDYATNRALTFGTLTRVATASPNGNDVTFSLKSGGVFALGALTAEPSLGFDWYHLSRSAFTEGYAGSAGLGVDSATLDLVMPSVGVRLATTYGFGAISLSPELSARYYYNFGDTNVGTTAGLIGAPALPFTVETTGVGRNIGVLAAGLSAQQGEHLRVFGQYELSLSDDVTAQSFSAGLKYTW
ncbi:autotransporter domain-containing protein [Xanthobacter sp. VTT E-85241]|uniref:autotransporter domain-containing protein n=1 Tax=Roseixanthobacter finlandensis TaxID=3119922 RepID=UPI00372A439A